MRDIFVEPDRKKEFVLMIACDECKAFRQYRRVCDVKPASGAKPKVSVRSELAFLVMRESFIFLISLKIGKRECFNQH